MQVWGHRGASGCAPENTLEAFAAAVEQGADGVELDVQLTADGVPVVAHDERLDRVSDGSGLVKDFTLAQLKGLSFSKTAPGFANARIPTLAEVFGLLKPTRLTVNVELKTGVYPYEGIERLALELAGRFAMAERVLYSSFNHESLLRVKALCPSARTAFLFDARPAASMAEYVAERGGEAAHPSAALVTPDLVRGCHARGLAVNVWNAGDAGLIRCHKLGVDAVITDCPDRARAILDRDKLSFMGRVISYDSKAAIRDYIAAARGGGDHGDDYDAAIADDERADVFMALSSLRRSLLAWYEFAPNSRALELGAGFGALTGLLCERCARVTALETDAFAADCLRARYRHAANLDVLTDMAELAATMPCDYVVAAAATVDDATLELAARHLAPAGALLLAVDNRFALRALCGAPVDGRPPFDGLQAGTALLSRAQLAERLAAHGFAQQKFYYPMPDWRLPQILYSDASLPAAKFDERVTPYAIDRASLVADEAALWGSVIGNGGFPFAANAFFVEARRAAGHASPIDYAAVTANRERGSSFVTTVRSDGTVRKSPLYREGRRSLEALAANLDDLAAHGLAVVAHHRLNADTISMPFIEAPTLNEHLQAVTERGELFAIFDRLRDLIWQSSDPVSADRNCLLDCGDGKDASALDWGTVLARGYLDLVPLNAFYKGGQLVFFDQEFRVDNCPAKFVLFRAVDVAYNYSPNIAALATLDEMKARYDLAAVWPICKRFETRFLERLHRTAQYKLLGRWRSAASRERLLANAARLATPGPRAGASGAMDAAKLHQIWEIGLALLRKLQGVCERHRLAFFITRGTLLGAVRHAGFIPWDDDVDVALPRKDYDRLVALAPTEFAGDCFLQTPENDPQCFNGGFARLMDERTTGMTVRNMWRDCHHGIGIDVFPLDDCPDDARPAAEKKRRVLLCQRLLAAKVYADDRGLLRAMLPRRHRRWYQAQAQLRSHAELCRDLRDALAAPSPRSRRVAVFTTGGMLQPLDRDDFASTIPMPFENLTLPAPAGYRRCLAAMYGENFLELPPPESCVPHHQGVFLPHLPYRLYMQRFARPFDGCDARRDTIVLFGTGNLMEDYMARMATRYPPSFAVDNNAAKWGTSRFGVAIRSPEALLSLPADRRRVFICTVFHNEIGPQLQRMGISDYRVYSPDTAALLECERRRHCHN